MLNGVGQRDQACPAELAVTATQEKVNAAPSWSPGIMLQAHPYPFWAKLLHLGFSPATETFKAMFSLCLLAETQGCVSKWAPKLRRVEPGESSTPSASQNHRIC